MRLSVIVSALMLTCARPVMASTIYTYTFTGIVQAGSMLEYADGTTADLSGAWFTASGTVTDEPYYDPALAVYRATTTYDFGVLGIITTLTESDAFWILGDSVAVGHFNPLDYTGFRVVVAGAIGEGELTVIRTLLPYDSYETTDATGQHLTMPVTPLSPTGPTILTASVTAVPEASTVALVAIGVALSLRFSSRRLH